MAVVKFVETTSAKLSSLPIVNGRFTFVTDTGALYRDTATSRVLLSGDMIIYADKNILNIVNANTRVGITVENSGHALTFNTNILT
jgi:hypothetical protein